MASLGKIIILVAVLTLTVQGNPLHFELAEAHGYPLEAHDVETEDGYILTMHRIPHGRNNANETNKPVMFMMHGIVASSTDFINSGPGNSLAYGFADQGYDVWMGNARGNVFSRKHKTLNPDTNKAAFFNFTWNEIGYYDIPAMIDYALALTNQQQLQCHGFSQGTTALLVTASTRPEYNDKIKLISLMAPIANMKHVKNPSIQIAAPHEQLMYTIGKALGLYEILPRTDFTEKLGLALCDDGKPTQELCKLVVFSICGYDREQVVGGFIPVLMSNFPAGSSIKQFIHYLQVVTGPFRKFDYHNDLINIEHYGSANPPTYDLQQITAPVALYYGLNDWLSSDKGVIELAAELPNVVILEEVKYSAWNHYDFIWAKDVFEILHKNIIQNAISYN